MYSDENPKKREILETLEEEMNKNRKEKILEKISYKFLE